MGNLFSSLKTKTSTSSEESEYLKIMEELKQQEENLYKSAQEAENERKRLVEESLKRQKEISEKRIKEMEEVLKRAQQLNDARKLLNIQASQLLCAIYYNYQFGDIDEDDSNWKNNVENVVNKCLSVESFWLLCKVPQLLPLLWMTGSDCDSFHEYKLDEKGEPIVSEYIKYINSHVEKYVLSSLSNLLTNVCQSNCKKYIDINRERNDSISSKCKDFLERTENVASDAEWVKNCLEFIKDDDKMNWKCFAARSGKGITKNKIRLLPSTFPKICPKYELYSALLMVTNTVINHYGDVRNENGLKVTSSLQTHSNGGQCFELNNSWISKSYSSAFNGFKTVWDGESYINVNKLIVGEKEITGYDESETEKWMKDTSLYDKVQIYGQNADGTGGYVKYVNPTQIYTHQFINDVDNIEVAFQMPRLSANINESFRKNFLYNIFNTLTTNKDYLFYNVYNLDNRNLLTSMDYIYIIPNGFEQVDNVSPICRYVFEVLIKYSCKWFITIPIESTMSMMKINSTILLSGSEYRDYLPQYIWASGGSDKVRSLTTPSSGSEYKNTSAFTFKNVEPVSVEIK